MKVDGKAMRSIWLEPDGWSVGVIDQTALPHRLVTARLTTLAEAAHAIRAMVIRGAPLIGATAAYGMCLALRADASDEALDRAYAMLLATRPTAINLKWALDEMMAVVRNRPRAERAAAAYRRAAEICEEDVAINTGIARSGLPLIEAVAARKKPGERVNVLTHCNAGWLATVDVGTATAPIYMAHDKAFPIHVFADETRPRNQGASLTAWELGQHGVPHTLIADNTGGHLMQHGCRRSGDRRYRSRHRQRRRLQQDRNLFESARRARQQRTVLRRAAVADHRFHGRRRRRRNTDRRAQPR
jgi:methylthioribose-1-phosphate isomerase